MKKIIAVDVDMVVVDTGKAHWEWLCNMQGVNQLDFPMPVGELPYNLGEAFGCPVSGMDFWRQDNLYSNLQPIENSVKILKLLSKHHYIVFVSSAKAAHWKNKVKFLKEYFPFCNAMLSTKEKKFTRCDFIIDDRLDNLENMFDDVVTINYKTRYKQSTDYEPDYTVCNWNEIYELFLEIA